MVGRTHGIHAEPTTFGLKLLVLHEELRRGRERLARARARPRSARSRARSAPSRTSSRRSRRRSARASASASSPPHPGRAARPPRRVGQRAGAARLACDQIAVELRHLARTEVREVEEEFGEGQKGSSAMPHKRNPWRLENVSGLARVLRGYALGGAREPGALARARHQQLLGRARGLPDASLALDFMLQRLAGLVETLVVYPERMRENLELDARPGVQRRAAARAGAQGLSREDAYRLVQRHAMETWERGGDFRERVLGDPADRARARRRRRSTAPSTSATRCATSTRSSSARSRRRTP